MTGGIRLPPVDAAPFLNAQEAAAMTISVGIQIDRAWDLWARQTDQNNN